MRRDSKRALFFPWSAGGGAAYTGHCIAVADRLRDAGWDIHFAGGSERMILAAGFPRHEQDLPPDSPPAQLPRYLPFANVERVYSVAARLYREVHLRRRFREDLRVIREVAPSVVITDMVATAAMAARSEGIPLVSIAEADFLSPAVNSWMPWFDGKPEDLLPHPSCLPAFRALARELGLGEVPHVGSLLWGDLTIVPSIPELDPVDSLPGARGDVLYAGPMFWDPPGTSVELPTAAGHHVYVTLGSGEMCSDATVEKILSGCARSEWSVFLSRGQGSTAGLRTPDNVTVAGFTGLARPLGWSDVVVSHGGSASVIASLAHDRPLVVVPFMSECEMNGRQYVERSGAGIVVRKSTFDPVAKRLGFCDRTGAPMEDFRPDDVASAVAEVLGEPRYQQAARQVGARLRRARERQGRFAEMVTDLVERHAMRSQRALGSSS